MMPSHQAKAIKGKAKADEREREARDEDEAAEEPGRSKGREAEKEHSQTGCKQQEARSEHEAGEPFPVPRLEGCVHGTASIDRNIRPVPISTPDVEATEVSLRLVPRDLDGLHARVRLGRLVPLDARLDSAAVAFEHRLNAAVGQVANIAVKPERLGFLRAIRPEVDALDATAEDHHRASLHGSRIVAAGKNFLIRTPAIAAFPGRVSL